MVAIHRGLTAAELDQAIAVARRHPVDLGEVASWAEGEGKADAYARIASRLVPA